MRKALRRLHRDERGMSFAEYLIILVVVAVAGIVAWRTFGQKIQTKLGQQGVELERMSGSGSSP